MLVSQKLAIAAHLHVMLRRKTGRVTDTEWMAGNLEYALEVVRFARAKALEDGHAELTEWADKLERAVLEPTPAQRVPLAQTAAHLLKDRSAAASVTSHAVHAPASEFSHSVMPETGFADSVLEPGKTPRPRDPNVPRYVGGIR
ncbi:hypothetical protein [Ramlibacter sp. WS9]|uniref:hypothetical protein n=1 Tax=Ramlibacter sp. WS9 TaxID=1882741 RepID=UPI0035140ED2